MPTDIRQTNTGSSATSYGEFAQALRDAGSAVSANLRTVGVDTNEMAEIAEKRGTELQEYLMGQIRARPLRSLSWPGAAGLLVGLRAAK